MLSRRILSTLAATGAAAALVVGGSAVADDEPTAAPVDPAAREAPVAPIGAVQPDQAAAFQVLRRPLEASDRMPPSVVEAAASPGRYGRNPELARAIDTATGTGWVVPARDAICLVIPDPVDGYVTSCRPTEAAASDGLTLQLVSPERSTSATLVPDGGEVVVTNDDRTTEPVQPDASGVAAADTTDAKKVTVITEDGPTANPVPDADGAMVPAG